MTDDQIQSAMRELAERARPAKPGLADTVLRRSRKRRHAARASVAGSSVLAVAAVAGLVFAAPWTGSASGPATGKGRTLAPADGPAATATATPVPKDEPGSPEDCERSREQQIPIHENCLATPQRSDTEKPDLPKLDPLPDRARQVAALRLYDGTWYVADPETGELTPSEWSWVTASQDGDKYAVLEKKRSNRIGIVDRASGDVHRWIDTPADVGQVFWSPTEDRLVATAYDKGKRIGFALADPSSGQAGELVEVDFAGGHVDFDWSKAIYWTGDGSALAVSYKHGTDDYGDRLGVRLLSFEGEVVDELPDTGLITPASGVATSADNRYLVAEPNKANSQLVELPTGKVVDKFRDYGVETWLDGERFLGDLAYTEITTELAVIDRNGDVVKRLWKAPKDVVVDAMAVSLDE